MSLPRPRPDATSLVTGASSGVGACIARRLAARGHHVTLVARRRDRLDELAAELRGAGGGADVIDCDLADAEQRRLLVKQLAAGPRAVDVLVNNAGFGTFGHYVDGAESREAAMLGVNVHAPVELCRAFAPPMVQRKAGAILTVSSVAAFQPTPGMSLYAGTKSLLLAFSASLHGELADSGVTVTVMCPGPTRTEFAEVAEGADVAARIPSALWMTPDAVAAAGLRGLDRGRWLVVPGRVNAATGAIGRHMPRRLVFALARPALRRL